MVKRAYLELFACLLVHYDMVEPYFGCRVIGEDDFAGNIVLVDLGNHVRERLTDHLDSRRQVINEVEGRVLPLFLTFGKGCPGHFV